MSMADNGRRVRVQGNALNPVARVGHVVEVADTERVRALVDLGVLDYVGDTAEVAHEADSGMAEGDVI